MEISRIVAAVFALLGFVLGVMTNVGPDAAESNFCQWIGIFTEVSETCLRGVPAHYLQVVSAALMIGGLGWFFRATLKRWSIAACEFIGLRSNGRWKWRIRVPWERADEPQAKPLSGLTHHGTWRISLAQPEIAEPLALLISQGDALMEGSVTSASGFDAWTREFQEWDDEIFRFIQNRISASKALNYRDYVQIETAYAEKFPDAFNSKHNELLNRLQRRLKELRRIHAVHLG